MGRGKRRVFRDHLRERGDRVSRAPSTRIAQSAGSQVLSKCRQAGVVAFQGLAEVQVQALDDRPSDLRQDVCQIARGPDLALESVPPQRIAAGDRHERGANHQFAPGELRVSIDDEIHAQPLTDVGEIERRAPDPERGRPGFHLQALNDRQLPDESVREAVDEVVIRLAPAVPERYDADDGIPDHTRCS